MIPELGKTNREEALSFPSLSTPGFHPFRATDPWASGEAYGLLPQIAFLNT